uniref:Putative secreted protein n=1 Tax=Rhipicephalus microplus TaxID=6941 RepID=A0A6G5A4C3_RHIMP
MWLSLRFSLFRFLSLYYTFNSSLSFLIPPNPHPLRRAVERSCLFPLVKRCGFSFFCNYANLYRLLCRVIGSLLLRLQTREYTT